jgi:predicted neuraminidase
MQQLSPDGRFRFDAQFVSSAPGQAVHAASLVELRDGRLRAVWFSGSREGAGDVTIQTAVMDAASQRWSEESTLIDRRQIQEGLWRYVKKLGNPVIARAPDGSLRLWMVNVSLGGWAGSSITWVRSTDEGATWSEPRRLVTSPFLNISTLVKGAPVAYQDGQIGLPVYHEFATKFAELLRLNTDGQVVDKIRIPGSQTSLQPVVLVAGPEQAQVYMRSGNARALMASTTDDAGKTWSSTHATRWPNPDSALAGVVTRTGAQWLALNPAPRDREILALLQTSTGGTFDGARPWIVESSATPQTHLSTRDYERLLGNEIRDQGASEAQTQAYVASAKRQLCGANSCLQEFSYPYLLQSRDGYIHLVYTWHRTRIKHVRLDPLAARSSCAGTSP